MQKSALAALRSHVLLRSFEAEELRFLAQFAQVRRYPASSYVFRESLRGLHHHPRGSLSDIEGVL